MKTKPAVKKLYRSQKNAVIGGVAAGLGEYFDIDPVIVRIIFVIAAFLNGFGIIAYGILWVLLPSHANGEVAAEDTIRKNVDEIKGSVRSFSGNFSKRSPRDGKYVVGLVLIVLGVAFFLDQFGFLRFDLFWPVLLVLVGLFILLRR